MKKIPTILPKDPNNLKLVTNGELLKGIKYFQLKIDGTSVMIKDNLLYVLLVKASEPAKVDKVPVVGKVTVVFAPTVKVKV